MTLRNLQVFLAVYETGSTTAAAKRLRIAQPSVSAALSELEGEYGVRLFERYGRRLAVTETGKELYPYARHLVDLFQETDGVLRRSGEAAVLRVGSSITIGTCFLPAYVKRFREACPAADVRVTVENTETVERLLLENEIDLGLVEGTVQDRFLTAEPYREDLLTAVCGPGHPFAGRRETEPEALAAERLILRERGSGVRLLIDTVFRERGLEIRPVWESVSTEAIVRAVEAGLGVSILPVQLVKDAVDSGRLVRVPVKGVEFRRSFSIVTHKNKFRTPALEAFIAVCRGDGAEGF